MLTMGDPTLTGHYWEAVHDVCKVLIVGFLVQGDAELRMIFYSSMLPQGFDDSQIKSFFGSGLRLLKGEIDNDIVFRLLDPLATGLEKMVEQR